MSGAKLRLLAVAALAAIALAGPALAEGFGNTGLVRGGAPLPRFTSSFPIDLGTPAADPENRENLEISLTSPGHGVLRFLFSPRTLSGDTYGYGPTVTGNYVGLAWNLFDSHRLFGSIGFAGAVNRVMPEDPTRPYGTPLFSLHSTLEFGYELGAQQSLSIALDHATASPYLGDRSAPGDFLRLRYGYHF